MRPIGSAPVVHSARSRLTERLARARAAAGAPHAEFTPVPAKRQARVTSSVAKALAAVTERAAPARQADVKALIAHLGADDFYDVLATKDPANARAWHEMGRVQRQFAAAEPGYDETTRAYSESMRLTLHAAVVQHLADPALNQGEGLYERFIHLHPTAFHENGGWVDNLQIPMAGALAVVRATPPEMARHLEDLADGAWMTDAATVKAAQLVRQARRDALAGWR